MRTCMLDVWSLGGVAAAGADQVGGTVLERRRSEAGDWARRLTVFARLGDWE